jgi:hypothetical protein
LEKGKSSSILLFKRRTEEKEGFTCSERDVVLEQPRKASFSKEGRKRKKASPVLSET